MGIKMEEGWKQALSGEFEKPYFKSLVEFVRSEYDSSVCYPPKSEIFAAFDRCPLKDTKVVIIGQDPYHGPKQANGLCFSVHDGIAFPPSLVNIFKEIEKDLNQTFPASGNLERWASQGVLLLNAVLTVRQGAAASHQGKGWEIFTDAVIDSLSREKQHIVFLLWGGYAKKKGARIDRSKHKVLETGHPSPLSANKGHWFGNQHFSKTNAYLAQVGQRPIVW